MKQRLLIAKGFLMALLLIMGLSWQGMLQGQSLSTITPRGSIVLPNSIEAAPSLSPSVAPVNHDAFLDIQTPYALISGLEGGLFVASGLVSGQNTIGGMIQGVATSVDARIDSLYPNTGYTVIPERHAGSLVFSASVSNFQVSPTIDSILVDFVVRDGSSTVVFSDQQVVTNLAPFSSVRVTSAVWTGATIDNYTIDATATVTGTQVDTASGNDLAQGNLEVSDTVYARDNGQNISALSIGNGTSGFLGQEFDIDQADTLTAARCFLDAPTVGDIVKAKIFLMGPSTPIGTAIATSDDYIITANDVNGVSLDLPFPGGVPLVAGNSYYLCIVESVANTVTLGVTPEIFSARKTWVAYNGSWYNNEDFNFFWTYQLRGIFGNPRANASAVDVELGNVSASGYTSIPIRQANNLFLTTELSNVGTGNDTIDVATVYFVVRDGSSTVVFTDQKTFNNLLPQQTVSVTSLAWTNVTRDLYDIEAYVTIGTLQIDTFPANDTSFFFVEITDSLYSRDDDLLAGSFSIGSNGGGFIGQEFDINATDTLKYTQFYLDSPTVGDSVRGVVTAMGPNGPVGPPIATTPFYTITGNDVNGVLLQLPVFGGVEVLAGNSYFVGVEESIGGSASVGYSDDIFSDGRTWVFSNASWTNSENLNIFPAYFIRGILRDAVNWVSLDDRLSDVPDIYPNPAEDILNVTVPAGNMQNYQLTLIDLRGRKLIEAVLPAHTHSTRLEIGNLAKGVYLLEVRSGDVRHIKRVTIR